MTARRYRPGQAVILSSEQPDRILTAPYEAPLGEVVASESIPIETPVQPREQPGQITRTERRFLSLVAVNRGEEQRLLDAVRRRPGVLAASLNYIAIGTDRPATGETLDPELDAEPADIPPRPTRAFFWRTSEPEMHGPLRPQDLKDCVKANDAPEDYVASIDVRPDHCIEVLRTMRAACGIPRREVGLIGLTAEDNASLITDLFDVGRRLMALPVLMGKSCNLLAINLSIDFSLVIRGYEELEPDILESPDMTYKDDLFERVLREVLGQLSARRGKGWAGPPVFAAAGNRRHPGAEPRTRLAYPASRPETIAATFVRRIEEQNAPAAPARVLSEDDRLDNAPGQGTGARYAMPDEVDSPATWALKPCLAVEASDVAASGTWSSFASAWCAGGYARVSREMNPDRFGAFGRLAMLAARSRRLAIDTKGGRLPAWLLVYERGVCSFPPSPPALLPGSHERLRAMLEEAATELDADLAVYGSTAYVATWLALNNKTFSDLDARARRDLGDVDLVTMGGSENSAVARAAPFVRRSIVRMIGRAYTESGPRHVEIHSIEDLVSAGQRLSGQIPVTRILQTRAGVLDILGGLDDLRDGEIGFLPVMVARSWRRNALFARGGACPAITILRWMSAVALLRIVSRATGVAPPSWRPAALDVAEEILEARESEGGSARTHRVFGGPLRDERERIERRLDRTRGLLASARYWGVEEPRLEGLLASLEKIRYTSIPDAKTDSLTDLLGD